MIYLRVMITIAFSLSIYSDVGTTFIADIFINIILIFPLYVIEILFIHGGRIKKVGYFLWIFLFALCWGLTINKIAFMTLEDSNMAAVAFFISWFIEMIIIYFVISFIKFFLYSELT